METVESSEMFRFALKAGVSLTRAQYEGLLKPFYAQQLQSSFGKKVLVSPRAEWERPYHETDQKCVFRGWEVCVWHPDAATISTEEIVPTWEDIPAKIEMLKVSVLTLCTHKRTRHLGTPANCLNSYECLDCGEKFQIDSSG